MRNKVTELYEKLCRLTVFRSFLNALPVKNFALLAYDFETEADAKQILSDYCELVSQIYLRLYIDR